MAQELIYTSFPKGVKPGVSGFCTVAVSPDMAPNMISRLEGLSGYRHLFMPGTPEADLNPPNWSHVVINVGNAESHIVYRVADAGLDYTGRSNKLAHFVVLNKSEQVPCGPAAMLTTPGLIDLVFDQQVGTRPFARPIPRQLASPRPCMAWRQAAGDPGWAGELAQTAWTGKYACIVYKPGMNVLTLIQEAMALLPPERRWKTTFSTYYSKLPTGIDCQWRCVVAGTPEAAQAIAEVGSGLVIDLSNGALAPAPDSPAVAAARAGRMVLAPVGTKSVGTAARQRPVQTSRPAADAAVTAGIQEELQSIDASDYSSAENDLFNSIDSMPAFSLQARTEKRKTKSSNSKKGLYIAIALSVFLIGIAAATYFVVSSNSSETGGKQIASSESASSQKQKNPSDDSQERPSDDLENQDLTDSFFDEHNQESDENTSPEAEQQTEQDAEETSQQTDPSVTPEAEKNPQPEAEPDASQAAIDNANKAAADEEEKQRLAELEKAKQDEEDKIMNDSRWPEMDPGLLFIYIDPNGVPDYSRLDLQLQKLKSPIVKLDMIQLYQDKSNMSEYKLQYLSESSSYQIIYSNIEIDSQIRICDNADEKNDSKTTDESGADKKKLIRMDGIGEVDFPGFIEQCALVAIFADESSKVISFFKPEQDKNLRRVLVQSITEKNRNGSYYTYSEDSLVSDYSLSDIKLGCSGNAVTLKDKSYNVVSSVNSDASGLEIRVEINYPIKEKKEVKEPQAPINFNPDLIADVDAPQTSEPASVKIKNFIICIDRDKKNIKLYKIKCKLELEKDDFSLQIIEGASTNEYYRNPEFLQLVKQLALRLPLYIDVFYHVDPFAKNASLGTFFGKRIVLPPAEEPIK